MIPPKPARSHGAHAINCRKCFARGAFLDEVVEKVVMWNRVRRFYSIQEACIRRQACYGAVQYRM